MALKYPYKLATGKYTGDNTDDRSITGVGFAPDFVLIKSQDANISVFRLTGMTAGESGALTAGAAWATDRLQDLEADGFQVGSSGIVNNLGTEFYWVAIQVGTTSEKVFDVGIYTGDGLDNRNITGLGFDPDMVGIKNDGGQDGRWKLDVNVGEDTMEWDTGADIATNEIQALITDGFQIGSDINVNNNGILNAYFAFKKLTGFVATGSYTGNTTDNRDITGLGFDPDVVFIKRDGSSQTWMLTNDMVALNSVPLNAAGDNINRLKALITDGFRVGTDADVNLTGNTYRWLALKLQSDAVGEETLTSNAWIKKPGTESSLASDSYIKVLDNEETLTSDSTIFKVAPVSIVSDSYIKVIDNDQTLTSDAWITGIAHITSDMQIGYPAQTQTITSDAYIKKEGYEGSLVSDAYINYSKIIPHGFQRSFSVFGNLIWRTLYNYTEGRFEAWYTNDSGVTWTENVGGRITANAYNQEWGQMKWADYVCMENNTVGHGVVLYKSGNDIKGRVVVPGIGATDWTLGTEYTVFDGSGDGGEYLYINACAYGADKVAVSATLHIGTDYRVVSQQATTDNSVQNWTGKTTISATTNANKACYSALREASASASGKYYVVWNESNIIKGRYFDGVSWGTTETIVTASADMLTDYRDYFAMDRTADYGFHIVYRGSVNHYVYNKYNTDVSTSDNWSAPNQIAGTGRVYPSIAESGLAPDLIYVSLVDGDHPNRHLDIVYSFHPHTSWIYYDYEVGGEESVTILLDKSNGPMAVTYQLGDSIDTLFISFVEHLASDAYIKATSEETITSDAYIHYTTTTITSDAWIALVGEETLTSDAYKKATSTELITSEAFIFKPGTETSIASDSFVQELQEETINSDAYIIFVREETLTSDAVIFTPTSTTITSDSYIKQTDLEETIGTESYILKVEEETLTSDAYIKKLATEETLNSDAYIKILANEETLASDSYIKVLANENTLTSNAYIEKSGSETSIASDSYIKVLANEETLASDAYIKVLGNEETINSDSWIVLIKTETIFSDSWILEIQEETITSDAYIFFFELKHINSNACIKVIDNEQTISSDAYIHKEEEEGITSDAHVLYKGPCSEEWDVFIIIPKEVSITSDAWIRTPGLATLLSDARIKATSDKTLTSDARIIKTEAEGITSDANIRVTNTTQPCLISADYINTPIMVYADYLTPVIYSSNSLSCDRAQSKTND